MIASRLIGILEAEQVDPGQSKRERNDCLIGVAAGAPEQKRIRDLGDLPDGLVARIGRFFEFYHQERGGRFMPIGQRGPQIGIEMVSRAMRCASKGHGKHKKRG